MSDKVVLSALDKKEFDIVRATQYGVLSRCRELVEANKLIVTQLDSEGVSLLHWASINNHFILVDYYLKMGADINSAGGDLKETPLHWAVRQGHTLMAIFLVRKGANVLLDGVPGCTPIHLAALFGHITILAFFLSINVDCNLSDKNGLTPLMHCCLSNNNNIETSRLILAWGADVNAQDLNYESPLHKAALTPNLDLMELLNKHGADWGLRNKTGHTPIQDMISRKFIHFAKYCFQLANSRGDFQQLNPTNHRRNFILSFKDDIVKLSTYPSVRKKVMLALPPFLYLFIGILLQVSLNPITKIITCCLVLISLYFVTRNFTDDNFVLLVPFSLAVGSFFFLQFTYLFYIWTLAGVFCNLFYLLFTIIISFTFYKSTHSDPGFLKGSVDSGTAYLQNLFERALPIDETLVFPSDGHVSLKPVDLNRFCCTCLIQKPLRSKHCQYCNLCVAKFDHHCPWILNCVGSGNHHYFLGFTLSTWMAMVLYMYLSVCALISFSSAVPDYALLDKVWFLLCSYSWFCYNFTLAVLYMIWVFLLFFNHSFQIFVQNLTTNEKMNSYRYFYLAKSPYNKGVMRNMLDFFHLPGYLKDPKKSVDWGQVYDWGQLDLDNPNLVQTENRKKVQDNVNINIV